MRPVRCLRSTAPRSLCGAALDEISVDGEYSTKTSSFRRTTTTCRGACVLPGGSAGISRTPWRSMAVRRSGLGSTGYLSAVRSFHGDEEKRSRIGSTTRDEESMAYVAEERGWLQLRARLPVILAREFDGALPQPLFRTQDFGRRPMTLKLLRGSLGKRRAIKAKQRLHPGALRQWLGTRNSATGCSSIGDGGGQESRRPRRPDEPAVVPQMSAVGRARELNGRRGRTRRPAPCGRRHIGLPPTRDHRLQGCAPSASPLRTPWPPQKSHHLHAGALPFASGVRARACTRGRNPPRHARPRTTRAFRPSTAMPLHAGRRPARNGAHRLADCLCRARSDDVAVHLRLDEIVCCATGR